MQKKSWHLILFVCCFGTIANFSIAQDTLISQRTMSGELQNEFIDLKWSEQEVRAIDRILPGKRFLHQDASEATFKQYAPNARIIHLATHALIDDNTPLYSRLLFSTANDTAEDGLLHTYELYNMKLNASLAVLSACNTGTGKLVRGEGIMSLARGFLYAGCPNVVVSLWPVDDQATAHIMQRFYSGLKRGMNKDDALHHAKLAYLKEADAVKSDPFYWANFILIGDANPVLFKKTLDLKIVGLIVLVVILSALLIFRKKLFPGIVKISLVLLLILIPVVLLLCHSFHLISFAQFENEPSDSIVKDLTDDLSRARHFQQTAQFDSSTIYFQKASAKFEAEQNWENYIDCLINISENFRLKRDYNQALNYLNHANEVSLKHRSEQLPLFARIYNNYGNIYRKSVNVDSAYHYFRKALAMLQMLTAQDSLELANSFHGIGVVKFYQGNYDSSLVYHQKALAIRLEKLGEHHPLVADSYVNLGIVSSSQGDFEVSLAYHQRGLAIRTEIMAEDHPDIANSYLNLGVIYQEKGDYDSALSYFERAAGITIKTIGENNPFVSGCYLNIGLVFDKKGDYEKALEYYNKSLALILDRDHLLAAEIYNNMGIIYKKKEQYAQAIEIYHQALDFNLKRTGENHPNVIKLYMNIANVHSLKNDYETAIRFYQKALSIAHQIFGEKSPLLAFLYHNSGAAKAAHGKFQFALDDFNKALSIGLTILGEKHPFIAEVYYELGEGFHSQGNFEGALDYYQRAIIALIADFDNENIYSNPALKNISDEIRLLAFLAKKAAALKTLYSKQTQNLKDLTYSFLTYDLALQLVDKITKSYQADVSKLELRNNVHEIYRQATDAAFELYQLTQKDQYKIKVYHFAEKSKAQVLQQALTDSKAKKFGGIPDSLLEKDQQLKIDLAFYNQKIFKELEKNERTDSSRIKFWQDKLFSLNREYESLVNLFEKEYPEYFNLKYQSTIVSPWLLQEKIAGNNSTIVEYFVTDNSILTFLMARNSFDVIATKKDSLFETKIKDLRSALMERDFSGYTSNASSLYEVLIAPIESKISTSKLIIIPDGLLGYIPFEALLMKTVSDSIKDYRALPYLINSYQISYHYSASLLYEALIHGDARQANINFVGFAPVRF